MSAGRTAQSLTQWAKLSLTALAQAKSQRAYDATFDAFFARYMNITVNGVHVARDIFKQKLFGEHVLGQPAKIEFRGATEMNDLRIPGVKGVSSLLLYESYCGVIDFYVEWCPSRIILHRNIHSSYPRPGLPPTIHSQLILEPRVRLELTVLHPYQY